MGLCAITEAPKQMNKSVNTTKANITDAGIGSKANFRVITAARSPSPNPKRSAKEMKHDHALTP